MSAPGLTSLWLGDFKSHHGQTLHLEPMTLLVGRNGSGKSNALDALALLALLADERDVSDVERGDMKVAGLRGGVSGAQPFGEGLVCVGCEVRTDDGKLLRYRLDIDATRPEIAREVLTWVRSGNQRPLDLIDAHRTEVGSGISEVKTYSAGAPRAYNLLSSRLAVAQAITKVPTDSRARRQVVDASTAMVGALSGLFILDPVPGAMREYVRIGSLPDRSGSTVSALVHRLRDDSEAWARLVELVRGLVEAEVVDLTFAEGRLAGQDPVVDVMVALIEQIDGRTFTAPARLMSDGTLRYLAIVASLLSLRLEPAPGMTGPRTLVVEEIENGLFPSQASRVLDLLRDEASQHGVRLVATTHSPALLDALRPEDHQGVVICDRGPDGQSELTRLVDHPRYVELAGGGQIGRAITRGELEQGPRPEVSLAELFG